MLFHARLHARTHTHTHTHIRSATSVPAWGVASACVITGYELVAKPLGQQSLRKLISDLP